MSNTLQAKTGFNVFNGRRKIAAGMLGLLVLTGCNSNQEDAKPSNTVTQASLTPEASTSSPSPTEVTAGMITNVPMMSTETIESTTALIIENSPKNPEHFLAGRFGSYYPEVANTLCVTKFQAEVNEKVRQEFLKIDEEWKTVDPSSYTEYFAYGLLAKGLELPTLALLEAAASDNKCPDGNNDSTASFTHNSETMQTDAKGLLPFTQGGVGDIRARFQDISGVDFEIKRIESLLDNPDLNQDGSVDGMDMRELYYILKPSLAILQAQRDILAHYN